MQFNTVRQPLADTQKLEHGVRKRLSLATVTGFVNAHLRELGTQ